MGALAVLCGCGGGGGGGGGAAPPPAKVVTKVSLFGTMSTNSRIATVQTTMVLPSEVMVNYSSPPGATSGTFPLRGGVVVPSGPVKVAATDINGMFDIAARKLTLFLLNTPGGSQVPLQSSASGEGTEIATINFSLATAGGALPAMPTVDTDARIGQHRQTVPPTINYLSGCRINFATTLQ
jgi:hypothetical protein